jgi:hypothetical protein
MRPINTNNNKNNIKSFPCKKCGNKYAQSSCLSKHKKKCIVKSAIQLNSFGSENLEYIVNDPNDIIVMI